MIKKLNNLSKWIVLYYLRFFARLQLQKLKPVVIGVTGSAGKSSAVNAISAVLKNRFSVRSTNQVNSETGIPLHILGLKIEDYSVLSWLKILFLAPIKLLSNWENHQYYVIEMGVDGPLPPQNMGYLLSIVKPQIGVFLNAHTVHSQNFDHLASSTDPILREAEIKSLIASEKGKLIESISSGGIAIINLDDKNVAQFVGKTQAQVITFGYQPHATVSAVSLTPSLSGTWVKMKYQDQIKDFILPKNVLTKSYGHTLSAAVAVGLSQGLSFTEAIDSLQANFSLPSSRLSLVAGINGTTIIDSSYNASPVPMSEALDILDTIAKGRKIALLGDMRELGQESRYAHEIIARKAASICDKVVIVGPLMAEYAKPILGDLAIEQNNAYEAAAFLKDYLEPNDTLLVKGSQNQIFLEYAVEKLLRNPQDVKYLCRRGSFWQLQRKILFNPVV